MSGRTKWSTLRDDLMAKPGAEAAVARARQESLEEVRLDELRHAEAVSQDELAGRLDVTQGAISKFEHADDVRASTLREYLEALGARLELLAVFDDEDRRVPVHLGSDDRRTFYRIFYRFATFGLLTRRTEPSPRRPFSSAGDQRPSMWACR